VNSIGICLKDAELVPGIIYPDNLIRNMAYRIGNVTDEEWILLLMSGTDNNRNHSKNPLRLLAKIEKT
jgi:hypothetical protein